MLLRLTKLKIKTISSCPLLATAEHVVSYASPEAGSFFAASTSSM